MREWWASRGSRRELAELVSAVSRQATRPVDGRLSGAFSYAPAPVAIRGTAAATVAPDVRIAAARIEARARSAATPRNLAALAVAELTIGEWEAAVALLEDAVQQVPGDAALHNDLAVAYLARADGSTRPDQWALALASARRAITLDPTRPEPYFNRALALHGLHMAFEENAAWNEALAAEQSRPWANEAAERQRAARARVDAAARNDAPRDSQGIREEIEDRLLPQWGAAIEAGEIATAERLLQESGDLADRLATAGGDVMAREEIARIRRFAAAGDRQRVRHLAIGHRLYGAGRARFLEDRVLDASVMLAEAATHFARADSPYRYTSALMTANALRNKGDSAGALRELATVPAATLPRDYFYLRGRTAWLDAVVRGSLGRYDQARDLMRRAVAAFQAAGEADNLIATQTVLAEAEWFLGERGAAWRDLVSVLSTIDARGTTRRTVHLDLAATMSLGSNLPEAAIEFHHALVRVAATDVARADAYLRRARTLVRLHETTAAGDDLMRASTIAAALPDAAASEHIRGEVEAGRAELFTGGDCRRALSHADAALSYLQRAAGTIRRASLLTVQARCRQSLGDVPGAKAALLEAIGLFEARRSTIRTAADRVQAFELERAAFKDLIDLEDGRFGDEAAALRTAERARAGVLAEAWGTTGGDLPDHRRLPEGVAIVYYESLPSRVLAWVLTREGWETFSRPIGDSELRRSVLRIQRIVQQGADLHRLRSVSADLYEALISPALTIADRARPSSTASTIVFVPDGALYGLPFSAMPDAQDRPLIASRIVSVAPSLQTFFAASTRLAGFAADDVLAVGDGHDPASTGLPLLPRADGEAASIAEVYPRSTVLTAANATKRRFLGTPARVIHFAGHTVLDDRYPMLSRMLLAPDAASGDSGWLLASDITPRSFARTDVVVLASCEGAAGALVEGEGTLSLARAFFAAGVPGVVASLWPVDDNLQTLMQTFHQALAADRDPARALRAGQLALLAQRGQQTPVRVWGGFIMLGGLGSPS